MMLGEEEEISNEHSFQNKSVWKRILVVAGGPLFNFLLAFIIAVIIIGNIGYDAPVLLSVPENSVAAKQGLQKGDEILEIKLMERPFILGEKLPITNFSIKVKQWLSNINEITALLMSRFQKKNWKAHTAV